MVSLMLLGAAGATKATVAVGARARRGGGAVGSGLSHLSPWGGMSPLSGAPPAGAVWAARGRPVEARGGGGVWSTSSAPRRGMLVSFAPHPTPPLLFFLF